MKKTFIIILTLVASLFLNSCSKADIMLSGDWWTIINDEVGSGQENLVIRFNSAKSTVNFALKSLEPKANTYYMIESLEGSILLRALERGRESSELLKRTALSGRNFTTARSPLQLLCSCISMRMEKKPTTSLFSHSLRTSQRKRQSKRLQIKPMRLEFSI